MIEIIRKSNGEGYVRLADGRIQSAATPKALLEKLLRAGIVEDGPVRVVETCESYVEYQNLAAALRGLGMAPAREYTPRLRGQSFGAAEIWDPQRRRWVRPERPPHLERGANDEDFDLPQ